MFLKRKIVASSIAEVVIAVSIIAICIGIVSLVFVRSTKSTINFQELRQQTEIQTKLWETLFLDTELSETEGIQIETEIHSSNDSLHMLTFKGLDDKIIWTQDMMNDE